jgi:polar amino acid transport system substrate-binding protein
LGLLITLIRLYSPGPIAILATFYVEAVRGTPLLIQLLLIFYGLPNLGIELSPMVAAVIGLGCNYAAYEAENYRAGIQSIPSTQMDAAFALGFSKWQSLRHIILPQSFRVILPPITNDFISLLKDSSLVSVITMVELTKTYNQLASTYFDYFGLGLLVAVMYFLIGLPFVWFSKRVEQHFSYDKNLFKKSSH